MVGMRERRSSGAEITHNDVDDQEVGGRQQEAQPSRQGGGYLDVCNEDRTEGSKKIARDPRIEELRRAGLSWRWVSIAEEIGYESFVVLWQMASHLFAYSDPERPSSVRMLMPHVGMLDRIQRNKVILSMREEDPKEIQRYLKDVAGVTISVKQIRRIIKHAGHEE